MFFLFAKSHKLITWKMVWSVASYNEDNSFKSCWLYLLEQQCLSWYISLSKEPTDWSTVDSFQKHQNFIADIFIGTNSWSNDFCYFGPFQKLNGGKKCPTWCHPHLLEPLLSLPPFFVTNPQFIYFRQGSSKIFYWNWNRNRILQLLFSLWPFKSS